MASISSCFQCQLNNFYSEMFMDTSKFSTRTLSALHNLEGAADLRNKKKDEYQWRKDMEQ